MASSADGSKIVAAGYPYIYTSVDFGATWTQRGTQQDWASVASSADGSKLVAVVGTGSDNQWNGGYIYTSGDSGATWTQTGSQQGWTSVASSADGSKLVAVSDYDGVNGGHIYTSADSGTTWVQTQDSWTSVETSWKSVASSSDGSKLVAVTSCIYTSVDSGASWTRTGTPCSALLVGTSVASSADGTKITAVFTRATRTNTGPVPGGGAIYTSGDSGATWTQTGPDKGWTSVASSADGSKLVAGSLEPDPLGIPFGYDDGYIYTSEESGATWTQTGPQEGWASVASSADGMRLVAVGGQQIYTASRPVP